MKTFEEEYIEIMKNTGTVQRIGEIMFKYHDTHGLSWDVIKRIVKEYGEWHFGETVKEYNRLCLLNNKDSK